VQCESGRSFIVNDLIEELLCRGETIVKRTPINKSFPTMKKQVERVRRVRPVTSSQMWDSDAGS
jgi:hypothetical protein